MVEKLTGVKSAAGLPRRAQLATFRMVEDDLLDTFCYGIALALGNGEEF